MSNINLDTQFWMCLTIAGLLGQKKMVGKTDMVMNSPNRGVSRQGKGTMSTIQQMVLENHFG